MTTQTETETHTPGVAKRISLKRYSPHYWRVTFNHPPLNIFEPEMLRQVNEIIAAIETDDQVKVVVLTVLLKASF